MLLSIITVSLNSEKFIFNCLESTKKLCNKFNDIEHIVYDGGSIDKTKAISKNFKHIKFYSNEKDKNAYDAMNKACKFAKGKYVLFLNSDDLLCVKKFDLIYETLRSEKFEWITGFVNFIDEKGSITFSDKLKEKLNFKRFLVSNIIRHPSTFVKKELYINNPFDISYKYAADYKFFLNLWGFGIKPKVISQIISSFRVWDCSLSSNFINSITDELNVRAEWRKKQKHIYLYTLSDKLIYKLRLLKLFIFKKWKKKYYS